MEIIVPQNKGELLKGKVRSVDDSILEQLSDIAIAMRREDEEDHYIVNFIKAHIVQLKVEMLRKKKQI